MVYHNARITYVLSLITLLVAGLFAMTIAQPSSLALAQDEPLATQTSDEAAAEFEEDPYTSLLANATSQEGVVNVHQVDNKWYLEIPADLLGRELFWYSELAEMPASFVPIMTALEVGSRMVKLERVHDALFVYDLNEPFQKRTSEPSKPGEQPSSEEKVTRPNLTLEEFSLPPALAALPIAAESPDGALVIDVTDVFATDLPDFSVAPALTFASLPVVGVAPDRSYVQSIKAFPRNLEISSFLTFMSSDQPSSASVVVRHSLTLLADEPMMPRFADPRVGYFTTSYNDFGATDSAGVITRELIDRYRLEKQDPAAELSEPVQPIVYYIGRNWPDKWRPYVKQAVEDWQVAFEAAGFQNAIVAMDAPSEEEDPDWDPADTRYSVIRWVEQPRANAQGPNIHDPRTGEILSAHVLIWSEVLRLIEQWYFTQASANDPQAQTLPLPDELMGRLLRYVVSHEVGHSLGLRHNHRASQAFTVDQLRDPDFTDEYATSPSIMSYGRFNYIAQPGDGVTNVVPKIGPYDIFAIQWGYTPIVDADSPEEERSTLNEWATRQMEDPRLAFGGEDNAARVDPNVLTENLGSDRIEATRLGIQNLERVMSYLVDATTVAGGDFDKLTEMYNAVLAQRKGWLSATVKLIGGVEEDRTLAGIGGDEFSRVPRERQEAALQFILENLRTPEVFLAPDVMNNIGPFAVTAALAKHQKSLIDDLLAGSRYELLYEQEILDSTAAYPLVDYLGDVQVGLFAELRESEPQIDAMRRELQRHYLTKLAEQLAGFDTETTPSIDLYTGNEDYALSFLISQGQGTDLRAAVRYNFKQLADEIETALPAAADTSTAAHLADLLDTIDDIID